MPVTRRDLLVGLGLYGLISSAKGGMKSVNAEFPSDGLELKYRVFYGGNEIGYQKISVKKHADDVVIEHETKLEVRVLFAIAYSLDHISTEVWAPNHQLVSINSTTIENGEKTEVLGRQRGNGLHIQGGYGEHAELNSIVTTDSFWFASALQNPMIINTRTGDVAEAKVSRIEENRFHVKADFAHGSVEAKLRFDNNFLVDAEIDSDGHIVRFMRA